MKMSLRGTPRRRVRNLVQRTQYAAGKVKSRSIVTLLYVGLLLTLSANHYGLFAAALGEDNTLHEALTCEEYDIETHTPVDITKFFEVTSPGAYFWFNISYVKDANISVFWFFPDGSISFVARALLKSLVGWWKSLQEVEELGRGAQVSNLAEYYVLLPFRSLRC